MCKLCAKKGLAVLGHSNLFVGNRTDEKGREIELPEKCRLEPWIFVQRPIMEP